MRCLLSDHGPRISKREIVSRAMNEEDNEVMAADLLIQNKIHYLPMVRNGYLVGIVTMWNLLKAMIEEEENIGQEEKS